MERLLKALFDYQRFERSEALQEIIDSVETRYSGIVPLMDEQLGIVAAAGAPEYAVRKDKEPR